uniref:Secreted protein n=1 Tax=Echinococcus canadensis TaxID=519352 RepID=A0A915EZG7_9CEST
MDNFEKTLFLLLFFCACETKYAPTHDWSLRYLRRPVEENHLKFQLTLMIKKSSKHLSLLFRFASFEDDHFPYFFAHNLLQHVCWERSIVMAINDRRPW